MDYEKKQLLLKDLCARLPYGVKVFADNVELDATITGIGLKSVHLSEFHDWWDIEFIKPYLRPLSSMTEEEKEEMCNPAIELELSYLSTNSDGPSITSIASSAYQIDWLNAHHFDYRGLIEKGLALEAPEGMYKNE